MNIDVVTLLVLAVVYGVGFYLLLQRSLMQVILGFVVLGHGANLFLQAAGGPPAAPAFVGLVSPEAMADPLPQALALTAVVITFGLTTFLLALAYRAWVLLGHDEVQDDLEDRRLRVAELARERRRHAEDADADDIGDMADDNEATHGEAGGGDGRERAE
ncbi:multisubunit Na+/H+ antiporter, MnhC subunit [Saccharomonospora marina XMU15]|uniref:Multisubunit Na+/H+ antiporter, MnhC subunit n=1 Tax=Saccharomonospora marina XMU15 TaxID=882083 RepID=H5WWQ8_9PSEU|nr:NADH-quinone oxidoreductase subunit K [Saccharomonospora marina]EHR51671.1 multisubunit Na+/H+ antiporter, MnhC subunit [Saccharomonospora marina XMU15]